MNSLYKFDGIEWKPPHLAVRIAISAVAYGSKCWTFLEQQKGRLEAAETVLESYITIPTHYSQK
jgi:hypothetical protein